MSAQQGQQPSMFAAVEQWWGAIPFGTKLIMVFSTIIYILNSIGGAAGLLGFEMTNIPQLTLQGQVWRILLTEFVHFSLIQLLMNFFFIYSSAIQLEKNIGTVNFLLDLMIKNFFIQVIYTAFCAVLQFQFPRLIMPSLGLFNTAMIYMAIRSFSNPEQEAGFFFIPVAIKLKYHPLIMLAIIELMSMPNFVFDIVVAILLGYIESKYFNGMMIRISTNKINSLQNSFLFKKAQTRGDFITCDGRLDNTANNTNSNNIGQAINIPKSEPQSFQEYQGKGIKIGGDLVSQVKVQPTNNQQYRPSPAQQQQEVPQQGIQVDEEEDEATILQTQNQQKAKKDKYSKLGEELL